MSRPIDWTFDPIGGDAPGCQPGRQWLPTPAIRQTSCTTKLARCSPPRRVSAQRRARGVLRPRSRPPSDASRHRCNSSARRCRSCSTQRSPRPRGTSRTGVRIRANHPSFARASRCSHAISRTAAPAAPPPGGWLDPWWRSTAPEWEAFYAWNAAGFPGKIPGPQVKGETMGLFRRKPKVEAEPEPERCPLCNERVPDGADECAMCGADLKALRPWSEGRDRRPATHA